MAQRVVLTDDLDGTEAAQTLSWSTPWAVRSYLRLLSQVSTSGLVHRRLFKDSPQGELPRAGRKRKKLEGAQCVRWH